MKNQVHFQIVYSNHSCTKEIVPLHHARPWAQVRQCVSASVPPAQPLLQAKQMLPTSVFHTDKTKKNSKIIFGVGRWEMNEIRKKRCIVTCSVNFTNSSARESRIDSNEACTFSKNESLNCLIANELGKVDISTIKKGLQHYMPP